MPETREELLECIKNRIIVHCTTAEQARAVLSFCMEMGERLFENTKEWFDSKFDLDRTFPNITFNSDRNEVLRCSNSALFKKPTLEFEDIAPVLQGDSRQEFEIDAEVFDSLFS